MKKINSSKAIILALTGTALTFGAVSSVSAKSMYNTYNKYPEALPTDGASSGTDGWVWGRKVPANVRDTTFASPSEWLGTADGTAPFGYAGSNQLNWAVSLDSLGDFQVISQQNAFDSYGVYADIDTGAGAWLDQKGQGWAHHTDVGLLESSVTQDVTLTLTAVQSKFANFGITVFEGMDTNQDTHDHHQPWNSVGTTEPDDHANNPWDTQGLTYLTYSDAVDSSNGLTFKAEAGKIYSIFLGGSGGKNWNENTDGYILDIKTPVSAVPVPAAAWLLGSGLMGLASFSRRKKSAV